MHKVFENMHYFYESRLYKCQIIYLTLNFLYFRIINGGNFHDHMTHNIASSSFSANPLDCYVWRVVKKDLIVNVMSNMNKNHLILARKQLVASLKDIIKAEGVFNK